MYNIYNVYYIYNVYNIYNIYNVYNIYIIYNLFVSLIQRFKILPQRIHRMYVTTLLLVVSC